MLKVSSPAVPRDAEENEQNISAHFPLFFEIVFLDSKIVCTFVLNSSHLTAGTS
jgi:hypothetical protein